MAYETMFARSFSRHDQKKLGYGAVVACLLIALSFCIVFKPYLGPLPVLNLKLAMGIGHELFVTQEEGSPSNQTDIEKGMPRSFGSAEKQDEAEASVKSVKYEGDVGVVENATYIQEVLLDSKQSDSRRIPNQSASKGNAEINRANRALPLCDITGSRSDFCEIPSAVIVHTNLSTLLVPSPVMDDDSVVGNNSWRVRPYARKGDRAAMSLVREWSVTQNFGRGGIPQCTRNHSVPAVMFSVGGFSGNHFHDFSDIILPLYLTSRKFDGEVQFIVTDYHHWWTVKFRKVLEKLSKYPVIDIDNERDVHCFPSAIVGLQRSKNQHLSLDPSEPAHYTTSDFREFLRSAYSLKRNTTMKLSDGNGRRPRLLILSRKRSRAFMNIGRILHLANRTGFDPVVAEAGMDVAKFAEIMNSCDVVMGVHGAGLTNVLFLPDNGVLIQVVPYGGVEWVSRTYFGEPARAMKINYLEYGISIQESTLIEEYSGDSVVIKDPIGFHKHNWGVFRSVYLNKQNVRLNVRRFKPTLKRAFQLLQ